jgi:hypothetical protein
LKNIFENKSIAAGISILSEVPVIVWSAFMVTAANESKRE